MFHSAFWAFFLVLGSDTVSAVDLNITPDLAPVPTAHMTNVTTVLPPAPTTITTVPPPAPTTTTVPPPAPTTTTVPPPAPTTTTVPPPAPTTEGTNVTTVPPPEPTTEGTNVTTVPPPEPTTEGTNVTTVPPPEPTTEGTNFTTVPPPEPTTEGTNVTTVPPPEPTTEGTNVTTVPPPEPTTEGTNVTTVPPPAPTPMPQPAVGSYNVRSDLNSTACLMATMGLRISYKEGAVLKSVNLDPNSTAASGKCGANGSDASLALTFDKSSIMFTFNEEGGKFRLHAVNVTLNPGATGIAFSAANTNLSLWEASVGSSYMCRKDQNYNITDALTLHTLGLQVQPFGVKNSSYATAHECATDDTSILIPIVVGAALAGLILIVMVAYVIGRRKTYVGYQTL